MLRKIVILCGKVILCTLALYAGMILGSMLAGFAHLAMPEIPAGVDPASLQQYLLLSTLLMAASLAYLSGRMQGSFLSRWLSLAFLVWIAYGVNTTLEAAIFTNYSSASLFTVVMNLSSSLAGAALIAAFFHPLNGNQSFLKQVNLFFGQFGAQQWAWRMAAGLLAFPAVYYLFGSMIAPIVMPYYQQNIAGLALPSLSVLLPVLFLRGIFFLICCLPVVITWNGSRLELALTLGAVLFVLVGGLYMLQATWLPSVLRLTHSLEILIDSFSYATILAYLFLKNSDAESITVVDSRIWG
jgi:hypothetical protein